MRQDPHLVFAGGKNRADFRGANDGYFNFLSAPGFSVNVRTQQSTFRYKKVHHTEGAIVNGTFMTEVFVTAATDGKSLVRYSQSSLRTNDNNWGWHMSNGTCDGKKMYAFPHHTARCGAFSASTDLSSTNLRFGKWSVVVDSRRVFGHLSGAAKRVDVRMSGPINERSHGLVGQSFRKGYAYTSGATDDYPTAGNFTTRAQAEGAIDGTYEMYAMKHPYSTTFKFSAFDEQAANDADTTTFASASDPDMDREEADFKESEEAKEE